MKVFITNINGHASTSTAHLAQEMVAGIGARQGFQEIGLYPYPVWTDTPEELNKRLDGVLAGLGHEDVVIVQTPSWIEYPYEENLIEKITHYSDTRLVIFIHDCPPLMFEGSGPNMPHTIASYNKADVLIAPSQAMIDELRKHGLTVEKTLVQKLWDHPTEVPQKPATFKKEIHFPGNIDRFGFLNDWQSPIKLHLYDYKEQDAYPETIIKHPFYCDEELLLEMSKGGFGLVWTVGWEREHYVPYYCSYKLSTYIAAGIPVIVPRGISNQDLIEEKGLGLVVDTIEEATAKIEAMTADEYMAMVARVRQFSRLVRNGWFTKHLLNEAVFQALMP